MLITRSKKRNRWYRLSIYQYANTCVIYWRMPTDCSCFPSVLDVHTNGTKRIRKSRIFVRRGRETNVVYFMSAREIPPKSFKMKILAKTANQAIAREFRK